MTPRFPGVRAIADGSEAIASVETRISEAACVYPITPSTHMATVYQAAAADGVRNLWGTPLRCIELESEHSSASASEGFALAGGRVTNFTAGQGLILMKEVLYVISGKRLPAVFHVGARAITSQALNIHAGHDDVMGVADVGWGMVFARNAQEAADLTAIARRAAEAAETPMFVVQDGFLTTHTLEDLYLPEDELLRTFVGDPRESLVDLTDPGAALMTGVVQNQDSYMKGRIAQRAFYERLDTELATAMSEWTALTGRRYGPVDAYECGDARTVVVAMGTLADAARPVVDRLRADGRRVGVLAVTTFRPFPADAIRGALGDARSVVVLERTDDPGAGDGPLTREVKAALADRAADGMRIPRVHCVSAGLGSRDVRPGDIVAAVDWASREHEPPPWRYATVGIRHPLALHAAVVDISPKGAFSLRGHSIGGLGSVATNRLIATLAGELFGTHVQAYPRYGSEKKGLPTTFFLTLADEPVRLHSEPERVDLVAVHDARALAAAAALAGLRDGGTLLVQTALTDLLEIWRAIPERVRAAIDGRGIAVAAYDSSLARALAPRPELVQRMQGMALAGAFLRVTPFASRAGLGRDALLVALRGALDRMYGAKGSAIVDANVEVVACAYDGTIDVTAAVAAARAAQVPFLEASA
ncbi:MAG TPA: 2-oxoacid:acceptor oxidoreductase family protein [Candidatus Limnocylindria bacterium]|nr:2-oxoacid:acceptor oxidoreductase family protein [Candidatus Limnocylindria bacterium]